MFGVAAPKQRAILSERGYGEYFDVQGHEQLQLCGLAALGAQACEYNVFFFQGKAAGIKCLMQALPLRIEGLFVYRAAACADENEAAVVSGLFGTAAVAAFVAGVTAQDVAVYGGDFVQYALFCPEIKGAVGGGWRDGAAALSLHVCQYGVGFDDTFLLQDDVEYLFAQGGNLRPIFAGLVENGFFCAHDGSLKDKMALL